MSNAEQTFQHWLESPYFDERTKEEMRTFQNDRKEIEDRFGKELSFGTGGLRGLLGAGTNRINMYTVRRATQGLADYIRELHGESRGVVIAYDSRHMSAELSEETALCLNANGIRTYRFESLRPTPELSFAVRELNCIAGVVITASHNPAPYNGYKVYWADGAQITPPHDRNILRHAEAVTSFESVKTMEKEAAVEADLYKTIGEEIDERYYEELLKLTIDREVLKQYADQVRIVYTPLHGTGAIPVTTLLNRLGITHTCIVKEQWEPDGDFTTCETPNPEEPDVYRLALKLAEEQNADLIIATDPDSDRIGVMAKDETGRYVLFNGNETGLLLGEYILSRRKERGTIPSDGVLMTTIVSSPMAERMADAYHLQLRKVLTGFKYIGNEMRIFDEEGGHEYIYGFEESYGCLYGRYVHDKDAQSAVVILAELAASCRAEGVTLVQKRNELDQKYGCYREDLITVRLSGADGLARSKAVMETLLSPDRQSIGGKAILAVQDYRSGVRLDRNTGRRTDLKLPYSNVVYFELEDGWCAIRPSGTEPKLKCYLGVNAENAGTADADLSALREGLIALAGI